MAATSFDKLILEALIFGISLVILILIIHGLFGLLIKKPSNLFVIFELFLAGFILRIIYEYSGINELYSASTPKKIMTTLVRQAARWSAAAEQDKSPMVALLHANYGAGYLWALKDIASDREIHDNTGVDTMKFRDKIVAVQDIAAKKVNRACPAFSGDLDPYLLKLGGDL